MPKSKRAKLVSLTKTKKKGRDHKEGIVGAVRECIDEYSSVYVFRSSNMRNNQFKEMKKELAENSRFFVGSNKVGRRCNLNTSA